MSPASATMKWVSATTSQADTGAAAAEVGEALERALGGETADLVLAFYGAPHVPNTETLASALRDRLRPACLAGVSAHGVIGTEHELEAGPVLTVIAARLPDVRVHPFVMLQDSWAGAADDAMEFARCAPHVADAELVVVWADPFSFDIERALGAFNRHAPGIRVVGGMASAGPRPGANSLFLNDWVSHEGGVGLALSGALRVDVVVSQGCRPIGPTLEVTKCEANLVHELDGQPALERAEQVLRALPDKEQKRLRNGLYVGRPARTGAAGHGDYLIRNLLGADRDRGILAIGDRMVGGERIRLHVRDAEAAREDLELMLSPQQFDTHAGAALVFACNGRGRGLYGEADRDITTLQSALGGNVPAAGMFCSGEIGPVGERNLLHGHTASIAIVRPAAARKG